MSKEVVRLMEEKNDLAREVIQLRQQTSELKEQNERLRGLVKIEMGANENCRKEIQRLTTTISLIRPLAFADHSSVEYNMEEIRKILNKHEQTTK